MPLKRSLSKTLSVYTSERFPWICKQGFKKRHQAVVGVGGNIGDVRRRFEHLFFDIQRDKRVTLRQTSLILKNPPFGFSEQEDFLNTIIVIETSMNAKVFLEYLMRLEKKFGRKRSFANAPRTLDLDIIFFDNLVMDTDKLTLPHPAWMERESVLIPLSGLRL
ncbi:2-amino-4-hydroxy-6-hydroxymethyldihydropteridine diphosphokinase [Sulfurimonas sp. SAG-AH-194-C21]|nr:2-amino-4-hydroxy-6-hydroxymethyldihydropteridine diphosphokinase [Sulfurimonas sp. SAG-AH-194-C21]MDF1883813.1 2-amino-4-hydroxy-6-hydroxymethyldihydropteridine diphosphokinase [Sulfurimonas sp. SAG-AH-194-C21]